MNDAQRQATNWLSGQFEAMEALLQRLVDTDSNSYDKAGVDAVGDLLTAQLQADGISVERIPVEGFGDVLLAELPGGPGKPVLLLGHRDTVFPKGTTATRGYTNDSELAYGPGVADMKGGLVLNCFALKALKRIGPLPFPVQILYTGDEEIGSASARVHIEKYARQARAVLNPEPGRASGNVVSARKGGATLIIEVSGRAAHSGVNHADGASAIQALAHKVIKLHALTDYAAGITTNVGLISGAPPAIPSRPAPRQSSMCALSNSGSGMKFSLQSKASSPKRNCPAHPPGCWKPRPFCQWKPGTAPNC